MINGNKNAMFGEHCGFYQFRMAMGEGGAVMPHLEGVGESGRGGGTLIQKRGRKLGAMKALPATSIGALMAAPGSASVNSLIGRLVSQK